MERSAAAFTTHEEYLATLDEPVRKALQELRTIVAKAAPDSTEVISYGMPAFKQHGVLVWYAANKAHIGFYPSSSPIEIFAEELKPYKTSKGAIQFPFDEKLPVALIKKIVKLRIQQDAERVLAKAAKAKSKTKSKS